MRISCKSILVLVMFSMGLCNESFAQQSKVLDSLKTFVQNAKEDTNKANLLIRISEKIACNDSLNKVYYLNEALVIAKKINALNIQMRTYSALGDIYNACFNNTNAAIDYFQKASVIAQKLNDSGVLAYDISAIAGTYEKTSQYAKSLEYYEKTLKVSPFTDVSIATLGNMGGVYVRLGDYSKGLSYYMRAIKVLDSNLHYSKNITAQDTAMKGLLEVTIGDIYVSISQYDKALANYDSAWKINSYIKNSMLEIIIYASKGAAYKMKGDTAQALHYYGNALNASREYNSNSNEVEAMYNLSNIYIAQNDFKKAMEYAQQSLHIMQRDIDNGNESQWYAQLPGTYITLGKIYTYQKKYGAATDYLKKALDITQVTRSLEMESDAWHELSNTYTEMGQPAKALDAYKQYITTRDSVYSQEKANQITRMEMQSGIDADSVRQVGVRQELHLRLQRQQFFTYGGFAGVVGLLVLAFFIFRSYKLQRTANTTIYNEKQKSDDLLLNILPGEVANELKTNGRVKAQAYDNVTVLFTDFVGFTMAAEGMTPQELVDELDVCFQAFDTITDSYGIEKIKTVGDAYLAVSGLPVWQDDHAHKMVKAAMEIRDYLHKRREEKGGYAFEVRVGIHTGNVVAGIVGWKKFAYDIWGDTVNIAARMEQSSVPGQINISASTYELVKDSFVCEYRGEVEAKNKGVLKMYFVKETRETKSKIIMKADGAMGV